MRSSSPLNATNGWIASEVVGALVSLGGEDAPEEEEEEEEPEEEEVGVGSSGNGGGSEEVM